MASTEPLRISLSRQTTRIGWIGCGVMGLSMCSHIARANYRVTVYSRTASKCKPLEALGCTVSNSVKEVGRCSDIVFTMVGYPKDVENVVEDLLESMAKGCIILDTTSSKPTLAENLFTKAKAAGIHLFDAPVTGGDVGAREGTLSFMCGGEHEVFNAILPLLQCMGKVIYYFGGPGMGQHTKMANQIMGALNLVGITEALLYASAAGLSLSHFLDVVKGGASGSWALNTYGPRILSGDLEPGFFVKHLIKDLEITLDEARRMELALPGLALAHQLYTALKAQGHGERGVQSLILALEHINNTKVNRSEGPILMAGQ